MSEEPNSKSKYILQDFANIETLWFETVEEITAYLKERDLDLDEITVYELGREVQFEKEFKAIPFVESKEGTPK
jgi:hypothetical protein